MTNHKASSYYDILGVPATASTDDIRKAFRKVTKDTQADKDGVVDNTQQLADAYKTLTNEQLRTEYDAQLSQTNPVETKALKKRTQKKTAAELLAEEKTMVSGVKKSALKQLLIGIGLMVAGIIVTVVSYTAAEVGESYTVLWGLVLWGAVLVIIGWYHLLAPYGKLRKSLGEDAPKEFYMEKKGSAARAVLIIAISSVVVGLIFASLYNGLESSSGTAATSAESARLETEYNTCVSEYDAINQELNVVNSRMDMYESTGDIDAYNGYIDRQNSLVGEANEKYDACEVVRTNYNNSL